MLEYNPFSYELQEDPFPTYRRLREEAPAYQNEALGFWALSRHRDVMDATLDWETYSSALGVTVEGETRHPMMISMDPPRQTRLRNLVSKVFTPRRISALEPEIRRLARGYLDPLVGRASFDVVRDFSQYLPMDVISTLLGIPPKDRDRVREYSNLFMHREENAAERPESSFRAEALLTDYFAGAVAERRARPREDLLSDLLSAEVRGEDGRFERLSEPEILGFCFLLSIAGNETVTKAIGNAAVALAHFPDERLRLVRDPRLIPGAVEELLRYDTPSHYQGRVVTRDVEIHDRAIPEGARVLLLTGSALRDERAFPEPDRLDIGRKIERNLALGYGQHICLGASVARLELRIALEELHARWPHYDVDPDGLERMHSSNIRGYASVRLLV